MTTVSICLVVAQPFQVKPPVARGREHRDGRVRKRKENRDDVGRMVKRREEVDYVVIKAANIAL